MKRNHPMWRAIATLCCAAVIACSDPEPDSSPAPPPAPRMTFSIPEPEPRVRMIGEVELLSESVVNSMIGFASKLRVRDFEGAEAWLADDFIGHDFTDLRVETREQLGAGTERFTHDAEELPVVEGRTAFRRALESGLGGWQRLEQVQWKVKRAEFRSELPIRWGRVELAIHIAGTTQRGSRRSIRAHAHAKVLNTAAGWKLSMLDVDSVSSQSGDRPLFVNVSRATGVAHEGIRYGQPGNDSDAWNGAAAGDVDGDGRFDVFVPSSMRNYLYHNLGSEFEEDAEARGLAGKGAGTGAVFFDFDNDGDQDLAVAHVSWVQLNRERGGQPIEFWVNDSRGSFVDKAVEVGMADPRVGFSWTAFDYDLDGYVDLFLTGYGRMADERNDSWIEASNGERDTLFRNVDGERFEDVTVAMGLADRDWTYGAAAADFDSDGDQDLYTANNFGPNRFYRNDRKRFVDVAERFELGQKGNSMGALWADVNGDAELDLVVSNPASTAGERMLGRVYDDVSRDVLSPLFQFASGNELFLQGSDGKLTPSEAATGAGNAGWVWASVLADFDLDGALDLYCVNGFVTGDLPEDT